MSVFVTHRGSVNAWECDENDHLNVRFFVAKANEGLPFVLAELGYTPATLGRLEARPRVVMQHMRFLKEARKATPLTVLSGIARSSHRQMTVYSEIRHSLTGVVLAALLTDVALVSRDGVPLEIEEPPLALRCEVPHHGAPRGLRGDASVVPPDRHLVSAAGFVEIARGCVQPSECDASGELETFQSIGRISDGIVNLMAHFQTEEELSRRSHGIEGGALLEYRCAYRRPLRSGSLFTIHSGLKSVGAKTLHVVHLVYDEASRQCAAAAEGVAVAMDLKARRAIEIPEARRRRMEAGLIKAVV